MKMVKILNKNTTVNEVLNYINHQPIVKRTVIVFSFKDERISHARTKGRLMDTEDKLEFALGEIEVLKKQIEREKSQFERTLAIFCAT